MSGSSEKDYPGQIERDFGYWNSLKRGVRSAASSLQENSRRIVGLESLEIDLDFARSDNPSPKVRWLKRMRIRIEFPKDYFEWMDTQAVFMHRDVPYRNALAICQAWPEIDHSKLFHLLWSQWLMHHEVSHLVCGHLRHLNAARFVEFEAAAGRRIADSQRDVRKAIEADADYFAARFFFLQLGRFSAKGFWDDFYGLIDARRLAMQDIALILLPLFLEFSRVESAFPEQRVHPMAVERLQLFNLIGPNAYISAAGIEGPADMRAYTAGFKKAIELSYTLEESLLNREIVGPAVERYKSALLGVRMHEKRIVPLEDDWLLK